MKLAPLGFWAATAHAGAVFAMSAGAVSFGQIVKAAEPAFAVVVGYFVYSKVESKAKVAMLIPIIGGIMIASAQELDFTVAALLAGCTANVASAFRGQENKRVLADPVLKEAIGSAANVYAITTLWATVFLFPVIFVSGEYAKMDKFRAMWAADGLPGFKDLTFNTLMAGARPAPHASARVHTWLAVPGRHAAGAAAACTRVQATFLPEAYHPCAPLCRSDLLPVQRGLHPRAQEDLGRDAPQHGRRRTLGSALLRRLLLRARLSALGDDSARAGERPSLPWMLEPTASADSAGFLHAGTRSPTRPSAPSSSSAAPSPSARAWRPSR